MLSNLGIRAWSNRCLIQGQLYSKLKKQGRLDEKTTGLLIGQLCKTLLYLHSRKIIHRDIKPENILLDTQGNLKLADFGCSNYQFKSIKRETYCGTLDYLAPEMADANHKHDYRVDIWSVGVLIFELLAGYAPFSPNRPDAKREQIEAETKSNILQSKLVFPKDFPALAKDLVKKILVLKPEDRYSLDQILGHSWVLQFYRSSAAANVLANPNVGRFGQTSEFRAFVSEHVKNRSALEDPNYVLHPSSFKVEELIEFIRPESLLMLAPVSSIQLPPQNIPEVVTNSAPVPIVAEKQVFKQPSTELPKMDKLEAGPQATQILPAEYTFIDKQAKIISVEQEFEDMAELLSKQKSEILFLRNEVPPCV